MKIMRWEDTSIQTYDQVVDAYRWCHMTMGPPPNKWTYGKDSSGFLGKTMLNGPEEIEWIDFKSDEDALAFKLTF